MDDIENIIREVAGKESSVLCREVTSIGDTMDVLRSKWVPEILTAVICGATRFKDIQSAVHGISDKVLTDRLCQMVDDRLLEKTVEQLKALRDIGLNEISLGVESGDDWTLQRINKGYTSADILEQCHKLEEAGIAYWVTFLNGVAGREHSRDHAINSAKVFNQLKPMLVGTGGLTLFPGTPLLEEAQRGEFTPLTEKELIPGWLRANGVEEATYCPPKGYFVAEENPEAFKLYENGFPSKEKLRLPGQLTYEP